MDFGTMTKGKELEAEFFAKRTGVAKNRLPSMNEYKDVLREAGESFLSSKPPLSKKSMEIRHSKDCVAATFGDMYKHLAKLYLDIEADNISEMWKHDLSVYCKYVECAVQELIELKQNGQ